MKSNHQNTFSQEFEETYNRILDTGSRLSSYLRELRAGRLTEGNVTQGLQSVEDDIAKTLKALTEQKFQVAVIAAMKAGKSTFLNAIIGADVLASETEACTVCRTDIRPIASGQTPRLLEYREGQKKPEILVAGDTTEIRQKFSERTHQIRDTNNSDNTIRFELEYPIEAISKMSSLAGFTLVDTPGPNEWESAHFNTIALKRTALEVLRTCDAILFILDYTSFKDDTNAQLLQDLIEQRSEFLSQNTGKIYFVLNKVDRKTEKDRQIADVIEDLRKALVEFGIQEPNIYPVSALQGMLAKLIQQGTATESDIKDFENFFSARYAERDERGRRVIPLPEEIASKVLIDSGILRIQETVIQAIAQNSGWNLLNDVWAAFDKAARSIDETLIVEIRGWQIEFEQLQQKIEEYKKCSDSCRQKVANVKKTVEMHKQELLDEFSQGIYKFAEDAKERITIEIERVVESQVKKPSPHGQNENLFTYLRHKLGSWFEGTFSTDPYRIRVNQTKDAEDIGKTINEYCTPVIQSFWLDTQDQLIRNGTVIREDLVKQIQEKIQKISDELSEHLGHALQVEISTNPIQFPKFEFLGIDAKIQQQQEVFTRTRQETRVKKRCCQSDSVYQVPISYQETISYCEIDLQQTLQDMKNKIDEQVQRNLELLQRVIQKQVSEDFWKGENQINDYINLFQNEFDCLLKDRVIREEKAPEIVTMLEGERNNISRYLNELISIREILYSWKPMLR